MYSNIALSPVLSEIDRCTVTNLSVRGIFEETTTNSSFFNASTASSTVEKLSNTYCNQSDTDKPEVFLSFSNLGYSDSTSQSKLPTSPFSFIPSDEAMSQELVITLPYFDFHCRDEVPTSPFLSIPLGKTQRLAGISSFQSIDLAVTTVPLSP